MIKKTFIGRSRELGQIKNWLTNSSGKLVLLTGPGGIGKTSLLGKIEKEFSAGNDFIVEYFDLAEQPMTILNQALHLADTLGRENFPQFIQKLTYLDTNLTVSASAALEEEALNTFVGEVSACLKSRNKKLLRITDTFEIVLKYSRYGDDWAKGINERLKNVPDTFFLIAGREFFEEKDVLAEICPMLEAAFGKANILHLPLAGFDKDEMSDFFAECDSHGMIPQEMREKLQLLTDGRPILLSLAVEWLQKNIPLPIMIEKSITDLNILLAKKDVREELLDNFEFELVSKVRQLQTPFDIAALYMAHIDRRMDGKLLSVLLGIDEVKAQSDLEQFLQFPFVKEYVGTNPKRCALHDEMRELVKRHAWKYLDLTGAERKRLTRMAIDKYYLPEINTFKKQKLGMLQDTQSTLLQDVQLRKNDLERWLLEAETLYYYLKLSNEEGYKYFDQLYYDRETNPVRDQILIDELKRAGAYDKDKIGLRRADDFLRRGQVDEARRECLAVLENDDLEDVDRIHGLNILGVVDLENAPLLAEKKFQQALELAESTNNLRLQAIVHNNLGRLFRNVSRLDSSIKHLKTALALAHSSGNLELRGSIRNNLAWTHRLNGDLDDAEALCSLSIAENKKRGQERPLAYAYLTKADIDRDKGDLISAERYAKQALDILNRQSDNEGRVQVYRTLANISRFLHNHEQALKYLDDGIALAQTSNSFPLLASLYQLKGRTCRHYADYLEQQNDNASRDLLEKRKRELFETALKSLDKSIELSRRTGNRWEIARSQLEVTLIMLSQESYDEAHLRDLLDKVWDTASDIDDEFLMGYVYENRARIEMKRGEYLEAGHAFGKATYYIVDRTGVEMARAFDRLRNTILDASLSDEQTSALARGVYEQVSQQEDYESYPKLMALLNMCQQILGLPVTGGDS